MLGLGDMAQPGVLGNLSMHTSLSTVLYELEGYAVLGLGDMALPGVLAAMCRCFDMSPAAGRRPLWRGHFPPAVAAYAAGGRLFVAPACRCGNYPLSLSGMYSHPRLVYGYFST